MKLPGFNAEAPLRGNRHSISLGIQSLGKSDVNRVIIMMMPAKCTNCTCDSNGVCKCETCEIGKSAQVGTLVRT